MKKNEIKKTALVLGGGGFIGGHLAMRLKNEGFWVRVVDIKPEHEFFKNGTYCDEYIMGDLRDPMVVSRVMFSPIQTSLDDGKRAFDEVYQLAADMGGAGYVFTGEHDADIMHNSALINLNVSYEAVKQNIKRIFYSSSACMYPSYNQEDPQNPNCLENSAYPANPDSEYGWEKLFSERLFLSFARNYNLKVRIARFHNIYGPYGTYEGGREKAPAAMCRKVATLKEGDKIEVWGPGTQTRSFMYINDCVNAVLGFMRQDEFEGPVNIGSEEMVTINELAQMALDISNKPSNGVKNIDGHEFEEKYGHACPIGVNGRNSDNALFREKMGFDPAPTPLRGGMEITFEWINKRMNG